MISTSPNKRQKVSSTLSAIMMFTSVTANRHLAAIKGSSVQSAITGFAAGTVIGTHDGSFHCDEALAIGMLKILPRFANANVLRTRNPELLSNCNIVVDVGAKYDPESNLFDHHQREFTGALGDGYQTKLSSAGLIYKHFGKEILREIIAETDEKEIDLVVDICYRKVYDDFMEHIDAIDNGISICEGTPRYHISSTLSSRVGMLNPAWNEDSSVDIQNARFVDAMLLTCSEFIAKVESFTKVWWPARSIVRHALNNRFSVHESGKIVVFETYCPWKDHLFELEEEARYYYNKKFDCFSSILITIDTVLIADGSWGINFVWSLWRYWR